MTTEVYPENRELALTLTLIKHMSEHNLRIAERAIRDAISRASNERAMREFDQRMAAGTL